MTTGAELHHRIAVQAERLGVPVNDFARPLNPGGISSWLNNLRRAARPTDRTIDRVEALLTSGDPVRVGGFTPAARQIPRPPGPPRFNTVQIRAAARDLQPPPNRDPCFWCGVRADIGCRHTRAPGTGTPS